MALVLVHITITTHTSNTFILFLNRPVMSNFDAFKSSALHLLFAHVVGVFYRVF